MRTLLAVIIAVSSLLVILVSIFPSILRIEIVGEQIFATCVYIIAVCFIVLAFMKSYEK